MRVAISVCCVLSLLVANAAAANKCSATFAGHTYDLSPIALGFTWIQKLYDVANNNLYAGSPDDETAYTFELQVCGEAMSKFPNCTRGSAINRIDSKGVCTSLGNANVSAFSLNPYDDGVYLSYYNGDDVNHIQKYSSRIYFVCGSDHLVPPTFEHEKSFYQSHFLITTSLACKQGQNVPLHTLKH